MKFSACSFFYKTIEYAPANIKADQRGLKATQHTALLYKRRPGLNLEIRAGLTKVDGLSADGAVAHHGCSDAKENTQETF